MTRRVNVRSHDIELPQPDANLFPLCGCGRLCLTCASACVAQCVATDDDIQCQQRIHHDGAHYAEGRSKDGRWIRYTWDEPNEVPHA